MTRRTARRLRRCLIDTTAAISVALAATAGWTHNTPLPITSLALFFGAGIAQTIENRLNHNHDEK